MTATSAMIGGQVNPQGGASYYIEYGVADMLAERYPQLRLVAVREQER